MRVRGPSLALVGLLLLASPAWANAAPYSTPPNAGLDNPAGPDVAVEPFAIEFRSQAPGTRSFHVAARDHLGGPVWLHVCIMSGATCLRHNSGNDAVSVTATPGTSWPIGTTAKVWVWTARVFPDGSASVATWGGLRAHFDAGRSLDDIVPYLAAGRTGIPDLGSIEEPPACGSLAGAVCTSLPVAARAVRVELFDDVAAQPTFEACIIEGASAPRCALGKRSVIMLGAFPAGATVEVRPYAAQGISLSATKGYALVRTTAA